MVPVQDLDILENVSNFIRDKLHVFVCVVDAAHGPVEYQMPGGVPHRCAIVTWASLHIWCNRHALLHGPLDCTFHLNRVATEDR